MKKRKQMTRTPAWERWKFSDKSTDKMLELFEVYEVPVELIGERFGLGNQRIRQLICGARNRQRAQQAKVGERKVVSR